MGQYNDFDLDIKKVQTQNDTTRVAGIPGVSKDNGGATGTNVCLAWVSETTCHASCGGLLTSCSSHCR